MIKRSARRKKLPLPKRGKPRRLLELGKDILIVFLICSAVYLAARSQFYTSFGETNLLVGLTSLFQNEATPPPGGVAQGSLIDAVKPVRMGVCNSSDGVILRYGVQYDTQQIERDITALSGFLNEALASAKESREVTQSRWREALQAPGIYIDLLGEIPLSALSQWMGEGNPALEGTVRQMVLAYLDGNSSAALYYKNETDGMYYACTTSVAYENYLAPVLQGYNDNGARFAFELDPERYGNLAPEVMLLQGSLRPNVYRISTPLNLTDSTARIQLQRTLSFRATDYPVPGEWVVRESDTLRISAEGKITYEAAEDNSEHRYPIGNGDPQPDAAAVIETTRTLVGDVLSVWGGMSTPLRLYLSQIEEVEGGRWNVVFQYSLDGAPVVFSEADAAARFTVENGEITHFTILLRCYEETGETSLVLREVQAAAALEVLNPGKGQELILCYEDNGSSALAGWVTR